MVQKRRTRYFLALVRPKPAKQCLRQGASGMALRGRLRLGTRTSRGGVGIAATPRPPVHCSGPVYWHMPVNTLAAAAAGFEDVALAGAEVEGDEEIVAPGEGAGAIQGGIRGEQSGGAGAGVGIPIPALRQIHENSLRIPTIIEQHVVALPVIQGLAEHVNASQHDQPGGGEGDNFTGDGWSQEDSVGAVSNPNEAIEGKEAAKRQITAWSKDSTERVYATLAVVQSPTIDRIQEMLEEDRVVTDAVLKMLTTCPGVRIDQFAPTKGVWEGFV